MNGDRGGWRRSPLQLLWPDVTEFFHNPGGKGANGALCAGTGSVEFRRLIPGLSREQSAEIVDAIYQRFPDIALRMDLGGLISLFGGEAIPSHSAPENPNP